MPECLLTLAQAVERTDLPLTQFHTWQRLHYGPPAMRLGGAYYYSAAALAAWLTAWWPARDWSAVVTHAGHRPRAAA